LDVVGDARVDLNLELWNDPAESLFDWIESRGQQKEKAEAENAEVKRLSGRLEVARTALEKKHALRDMEQRVKELGRQAAKAVVRKLDDATRGHDLDTIDYRGREEAILEDHTAEVSVYRHYATDARYTRIKCRNRRGDSLFE